jgi:hypothetical protein
MPNKLDGVMVGMSCSRACLPTRYTRHATLWRLPLRHCRHGRTQAPDVPDKTHHLKKTDFSQYTEVKVRLMNHIKGN